MPRNNGAKAETVGIENNVMNKVLTHCRDRKPKRLHNITLKK
uniref:Uncharacterized protein n=1 Tax=Peronospora matthiolae TaxID=2874970 RepID=A0AAV1UVC4_9STRA